jgi:hypothetical protein
VNKFKLFFVGLLTVLALTSCQATGGAPSNASLEITCPGCFDEENKNWHCCSCHTNELGACLWQCAQCSRVAHFMCLMAQFREVGTPHCFCGVLVDGFALVQGSKQVLDRASLCKE